MCWVAFAPATFLFAHLGLEAAALLGRIGQLAEGIGEFDATGVKLEALRQARIAGVGPCQGCELGWIFVEDGGASIAKMGFDLGEKDAAEGVAPGVIRGHAHALGSCRGAECRRVRPGTLKAVQQIDASVSVKGLRNAEALGLSKGIGSALTMAEQARAGGLGGEAQELGAILHELLVRPLGAIPFEHREGGMMQRAALAIAEHRREGKNPLLAGRQQLLAREFGGGGEIKGVPGPVRIDQGGAEGVQVGLVTRRNLQNAGVDFQEALIAEPAAERGHDASARQQERAAVGMVFWVPPRTWALGWQAFAPWRGSKRPLESAQF